METLGKLASLMGNLLLFFVFVNSFKIENEISEGFVYGLRISAILIFISGFTKAYIKYKKDRDA
jgi:hypothetical protein